MPSFVTAMLVALLTLATGMPASAQGGQSFTFIRDAEIEQTVHLFARPILEAAAINPQSVSIVLVQEDDLNAFVAGGQNIYVFTGLIRKATTPEELIGVLAHEAGHIAGGHLVRTQDAIRAATVQSLVAAIIGIGAGVAAGSSEVGTAVLAGGSETARRSLLAFTRQQENAADQAAITYMNAAGLSPEGLLAFMRTLEGQELVPEGLQDEYVRTHPLTRSRIEALEHAVAVSPHRGVSVPEDLRERHRRMVAKLTGYLHPAEAQRLYRADAADIASRYGRAIADYRQHRIPEALASTDALIRAEPDNPYFWELRGQIITEHSGSAGYAIADGVEAYRRAVALMPDSALIRIAAANALLQGGDATQLGEAVGHLQLALGREEEGPGVHRMLAQAYAGLGNRPMAELHAAELSRLRGDRRLARAQAERARAALPAGSPGRLRADDLISQLDAGDKD